jgi:hypothetical protein
MQVVLQRVVIINTTIIYNHLIISKLVLLTNTINKKMERERAETLLYSMQIE